MRLRTAFSCERQRLSGSPRRYPARSNSRYDALADEKMDRVNSHSIFRSHGPRECCANHLEAVSELVKLLRSQTPTSGGGTWKMLASSSVLKRRDASSSASSGGTLICCHLIP